MVLTFNTFGTTTPRHALIVWQGTVYKNVIAAYVPDAVCDQCVKDRIIFMKKKDVHVGYLPYTKHNLLTLCYRMLGQRYGWGSENGHHDCSALMQKKCTRVWVSDCPELQGGSLWQDTRQRYRSSLFRKNQRYWERCPWGALLYFPGHIGLYMGMRRTGQETELPHMLHMFWAMRRWKKSLKKQMFACMSLQKQLSRRCVASVRAKMDHTGSYLERLASIHVLHRWSRDKR